MNDGENIISVNILDRSYKIKCPHEQAPALQESARFVDEQMRKLRQTSNITSVDRIAVVTALNICNELMMLKRQKATQIDTMDQRLKQLHSRIQNFLAQEEEVAL